MEFNVYRIFLFVGLLFGGCQNKAVEDMPKPEEARFVWLNEHGNDRQVYALFRNDFELKLIPEIAYIHLYADSRYHLFINGTYINFGPGRSYPENPQYDTYDIAPFLQKGKNVIAVKVLSNGMNTYQVPKSIGGFVFWGKISDGTQKIDLSTPGNWMCTRSEAYDPTSPKMSFATGPIEVFDARLAITDWNELEADTEKWHKPVELNEQDHWGTLEPRVIPHLTNDKTVPKFLLNAYHLSNEETILSFREKLPDLTREDMAASNWMYAYTYIYSPVKQTINAGLWWGEYWLNGKDVKPDFNQPSDRNNLSYAKLDLKAGWNFFLITYGVFQSLWDFYMSVPSDAGLLFSPDKSLQDSETFAVADPKNEEVLGIVGKKSIQYKSHTDLPDELSNWTYKTKDDFANNPAWDMAWTKTTGKLNLPQHQVGDIQINDTTGVALVFDMGGKMLGRIFIDYEAPEGTFVDIGFAEDLNDNLVNILKRPGIYTATRHISNGGKQQYQTFKPYGLRYLQVNIRNYSTPVKIHELGVMSQIYPFEKRGSFYCSDPVFNAIWELGWRTLRVCSEDTYTDTPFRERGLYAGDALPEFAITLATSGDPLLMKKSLQVFQDMYIDLFQPNKEKPEDTPGLISDFPFITLECFRWYIEWSKDGAFAEALYPNYKHLVESMMEKRDEKGLFKNDRVFIEWTQIDKNAQLTAMQAIIARSFENLSILAGFLGKKEDYFRYKELSEETRKAIRSNCWDDDKGAYLDGFRNGSRIDNHYPISSAWMSLSDYNTEDQELKLASFYEKELNDIGNLSRRRKITPYGGFYMLGALYRHEQAGTAEDFIRKYWSPMILKHDDTAWENFDDGSGPDSGQGTLSHAWSGGPTYYMSTQTLGVRLGFPYHFHSDTIYIEPQAEDIHWARGTVPHPLGDVKVEWKVVGDKLFLAYLTPKGAKVKIAPRGKLGKLKLYLKTMED